MDFGSHSIIWTILVGLVIGAIAKLLMPGQDPGGCILTILLGIAGALVGTWLGRDLCRRELRRRLDHVDCRRHDPVAAVSVAFQTPTIGRTSRCDVRTAQRAVRPLAH